LIIADSASSDSRFNSKNYHADPLYLQGSNHPGMQLTNVKLNGLNFQQWSRAVKIALRTKMKLGFLDATCGKPALGSSTYDQWIRCDSMVVSWLLNSIDPSLSGAFIYANSAVELWNELT